MHPELFRIPIPDFLQGFLPASLTIFSYGTLIALGAVLGTIYTARQAKLELGIPFEKTQSLVIWVIVAAVVGGRFFFFFENPEFYFSNPANMLSFSSSGFVFYGSLLFAIPTMLWFFKANEIPTLPMLDIMGVTACIVHGFGRLGCFAAGCCYGVDYNGPLALTFTDPKTKAPLETSLFPTQPGSALMIFTILLVLLKVRRQRQFEGQVFLVYIGLYSVGRSIMEEFRGDSARGYIMEGWLSHSQLISAIMLLGVLYFYFKLKNRNKSLPE